MITIFNRKLLYFGSEMAEFDRIRNILDENSIKYNYKLKNRMNDCSHTGSVRSSVGSLGNNIVDMNEYTVFVHKADFANAEFLIRK